MLGTRAQHGDHGEFVLRGRRAGEEGTDLWGRAVGGSAVETGPSGVACACRGWLAGPGWRERRSAGRRGEESAWPRVWAARGESVRGWAGALGWTETGPRSWVGLLDRARLVGLSAGVVWAGFGLRVCFSFSFSNLFYF